MPFPDGGSRVEVIKPGVSHDGQIGLRRGVDRAQSAGRARRQHMAEPSRLPGPVAPAVALQAVDGAAAAARGEVAAFRKMTSASRSPRPAARSLISATA
jgi:hypothetical protein